MCIMYGSHKIHTFKKVADEKINEEIKILIKDACKRLTCYKRRAYQADNTMKYLGVHTKPNGRRDGERKCDKKPERNP